MAKLRDLYEYVWHLRPTERPTGVYAPYNLLAYLALADFLSVERPGEEVQNAIFEMARAHGIKPPAFYYTRSSWACRGSRGLGPT